MLRRLFEKFSSPKNLVILNGLLIGVMILANIYFQAFCIPTTWTIILLTVCYINTAAYPLLVNSKYASLSSFINGLSFVTFLYCIVFLEQMNLVGLALSITGIGLVILIPHFFVIQLLWKNLVRPYSKTTRLLFLTPVILSLFAVHFIGQEYRNAVKSIDLFIEGEYQSLDRDFFTEKILGMHFIYNTKIEMIYDGWRPPKHEPILVIGMWMNNRLDPLNVDLLTRINLYKKFFPSNKVKFNCSCGIEYSNTYHNDPIWNK